VSSTSNSVYGGSTSATGRRRRAWRCRRIEQDNPGQIAGSGGRDDLAAKPAFHQQRQPSAMVEMGVGQHHDIDRARVEAEIGRVLVFEIAAALDQPAVSWSPDGPPVSSADRS
jgi:hypothetical protein